MFIERANGIITRESIAGKLFTGQKHFMIDEITIEKEQSTLAKKETPNNLKPNDPRGKNSMNKLASEPSYLAKK